MIGAGSIQPGQSESFPDQRSKRRFASHGSGPTVLVDVYQENINIAIWQRKLSAALQDDVRKLAGSVTPIKLAMTVSPTTVLASVSESLRISDRSALSTDVAELMEMFCDLFGLARAGLRISELDTAMCPRFHVDMVPCRLVTTYCGVGTEWLPHGSVDRTKLGSGSNGQPDHRSGLVRSACDIQQLDCGDVALLKGERWEGNADGGLVHRSPAVSAGERRLLVTLDFSS